MDAIKIKIALIGDPAVGKTSIAKRCTDPEETIQEPYKPTVGANYSIKTIPVDGKEIELQIWDTAGQELYRSVAPLYYRGADAGIFIYDVTSEITFTNLKEWIDTFCGVAGDDKTIFIVGNKIDLSENIAVNEEEANKWATESGYFNFRVSAKDNTNIQQLFESIAAEASKTKQAEQNREEIALQGTKSSYCPC